MKIQGFFFFMLFSYQASFGQSDTSMVAIEMKLENLLDNLRNATSNTEKNNANKEFKSFLYESINRKEAFSYPFSRLKTLGCINSSDQLVRIFNWNVEQDDKSQKYYCIVLRFDEKKNEISRIELTESNDVMALKPTEILEGNQWYGALYYQIVPFEKNNRDMYILIGWDGNNASTNMKIVDVLYFSGNKAKLGSPVFKIGNQTQKRLFYEYSKKSSMSLRYDEKYDRILMDHLSPESPGLAGFYAYYVPDMSYDALMPKAGKWVLKEDVIAVNGKVPEKREIQVPDENGDLKDVKLKNKWMDPSDSGSPTGGNTHTAELPEENDNPKDKKKSEKTAKTKPPKDNRNPNNPYPYSDVRKMKKKRKK